MDVIHVIPDDDYTHIQSETCGCNPKISNSEGNIYYIHNIIIYDESIMPNYKSCKD